MHSSFDPFQTRFLSLHTHRTASEAGPFAMLMVAAFLLSHLDPASGAGHWNLDFGLAIVDRGFEI